MEDKLYISKDGTILVKLIGNYDEHKISFKGEVIESSAMGISIGEIDTWWYKHQFDEYTTEPDNLFPIY